MEPSELIRNPLLVTALAITIIYGIGNLFIKREKIQLEKTEHDVTREGLYIALVQDNVKRLAVLEIKFDELNTRYVETAKELDTTQRALQQSQERVRDLENEVEILQRKNSQLERENASIRSELAELRAKLSRYESNEHNK